MGSNHGTDNHTTTERGDELASDDAGHGGLGAGNARDMDGNEAYRQKRRVLLSCTIIFSVFPI